MFSISKFILFSTIPTALFHPADCSVPRRRSLREARRREATPFWVSKRGSSGDLWWWDYTNVSWRYIYIPTGKLTLLLKIAIYIGFTHWKWWFSIVMLVYLRVYIYIVGETSILVGKYQKKHQLMEVFLYNGYVHIYIYLVGLEHEFYFPIYWECHDPNWRTHISQRGWNHVTRDGQKDILYIYIWLVWNMNFIFAYIGNVMIPTDELIFFRGVETT